MEIPRSLPARVYLLAHDPEKHKLASGDRIGLALRAAALAELYLGGHLSDDNGRPKATGLPVKGDPLLAELLHLVAGAKPMPWHRWISKEESKFRAKVRDQLAHQKFIRVEPRRILGIFPSERIIMRENRPVAQLRQTVSRTLRGGEAQPDKHDAAMTALVAEAKLRLVIDRRHARERKHRIKQLSETTGPILAALHKAILVKQSSSQAG
jgi:hypothetical protein